MIRIFLNYSKLQDINIMNEAKWTLVEFRNPEAAFSMWALLWATTDFKKGYNH